VDVAGRASWRLLMGGLLVLAGPAGARAQPTLCDLAPPPDATQGFLPLPGPPPASPVFFGLGVAIEGDDLIVSRPGDGRDPDPVLAGSLLPHRYDGTRYLAQPVVQAAEALPLSLLGSEMVLDGPRLVAHGKNALRDLLMGRGSVHVFERPAGSWVEVQQLVAPVASDGMGFGAAIALQGDRLVAGAPYHFVGEPEVGIAFVFEHDGSTWQDVAQLLSTGTGPFQTFGRAVALDGDTILVGAPGDREGVFNAGAAYVFERSGGSWPLEQMLSFGAPTELQNVGTSVALQGDRAYVGGSGLIAPGVGVVVEYERIGGVWSMVDVISPEPLIPGTAFGATLALDGDLLVVGAADESDLLEGAGAVYVFYREAGGWTQEVVLTAPFGAMRTLAGFGSAVDVDGSRVLVGAPEIAFNRIGSAHLFVDCAPGDSTAFQVPAESCSLRVSRVPGGQDVELHWTDPTRWTGSSTAHDAASDTLASLRSLGGVFAPCIASALDEAEYLDTRATPAGDGWYYLVRSHNRCGPGAGEGWGGDSLGAPRASCP